MQSENDDESLILSALSDGIGNGPQNPISLDYAHEATAYLKYKRPAGEPDSKNIVLHAAEKNSFRFGKKRLNGSIVNSTVRI